MNKYYTYQRLGTDLEIKEWALDELSNTLMSTQTVPNLFTSGDAYTLELISFGGPVIDITEIYREDPIHGSLSPMGTGDSDTWYVQSVTIPILGVSTEVEIPAL